MEKQNNLITQALIEIKRVEEKFCKIQENPAMNGATFGLTAHEQVILEKLIALCGEVNIAGDSISKRVLGI